MTSLTRWLLRTFVDEWPGGLPESGDADGPLYLEDRDDSVVVDPGVSGSTGETLTGEQLTGGDIALDRQTPSQKFDLSTGNTIGVALAEYPQEPAGLGGREYRVEPVLTVRIEAAAERQHGHIPNAATFEALALEAVKVVQNIDNGTLVRAPVADFHVAEPQNNSPDMSGYKDYFRWDFEVRASGYRTV